MIIPRGFLAKTLDIVRCHAVGDECKRFIPSGVVCAKGTRMGRLAFRTSRSHKFKVAVPSVGNFMWSIEANV
jgi:hypothetical protein